MICFYLIVWGSDVVMFSLGIGPDEQFSNRRPITHRNEEMMIDCIPWLAGHPQFSAACFLHCVGSLGCAVIIFLNVSLIQLGVYVFNHH